MSPSEAAQVLSRLTPDADRIDVSVEVRDDLAMMHLRSLAVPSRRATVVTPGDRWFTLQIAGGFSLDQADEDLTSEEVEDYLRRFVGLAFVYVTTGGRIERSRLLSIPALEIDFGDERVRLYRGFGSTSRQSEGRLRAK